MIERKIPKLEQQPKPRRIPREYLERFRSAIGLGAESQEATLLDDEARAKFRQSALHLAHRPIDEREAQESSEGEVVDQLPERAQNVRLSDAGQPQDRAELSREGAVTRRMREARGKSDKEFRYRRLNLPALGRFVGGTALFLLVVAVFGIWTEKRQEDLKKQLKIVTRHTVLDTLPTPAVADSIKRSEKPIAPMPVEKDTTRVSEPTLDEAVQSAEEAAKLEPVITNGDLQDATPLSPEQIQKRNVKKTREMLERDFADDQTLAKGVLALLYPGKYTRSSLNQVGAGELMGLFTDDVISDMLASGIVEVNEEGRIVWRLAGDNNMSYLLRCWFDGKRPAVGNNGSFVTVEDLIKIFNLRVPAETRE